jgi:energy-coupling factor transport system permease protein
MQTVYVAGDSFLHRLNPLSKVLATLPVMVFMALTTDIYTPVAFIGLLLIVTLGLGHIPLGRLVQLVSAPAFFLLGFVVFYPLVVRPELVNHTPILWQVGPLTVYQGGLLFGLTTGLRLYTLLLCSLPFSLTTDSSDFIRALVQRWRLPYRIGYGTLAAFRFVPMLQTELRVIQSAHKVRGLSSRGGLRARYQQLQRYAVPLLATAIRQAERTALAMDGRAFGAFETRTYYRQLRFTVRDYVFVIGFWLVAAGLVGLIWQAGLLGPLMLMQDV